MEEIKIILERHSQKILSLEREMSVMQEVQKEIRSMNETLVMFANELKHTNEHLSKHEKKIDEIDSIPKNRINYFINSLISAVTGCLISIIINMLTN